MPGIAGICSQPLRSENVAALIDSIDLTGTHTRHVSRFGSDVIAVSHFTAGPLGNSYHHEDDQFIAGFAGDLVDHVSVPWEILSRGCRAGRFEAFARLNGRFAVAIYDKLGRKLYLASDRTAQYPLHYLASGDRLVFSTSMATLVRMGDSPSFSREWLYEYLFFNVPISDRTFLVDVKRLSPATVLRYDVATAKLERVKYAPRFEPREPLLRGRQALDQAVQVLEERVPKYFSNAYPVKVALTGGMDTRTNLSLAPNPDHVTTYTYGAPGCTDILEAQRVSEALSLQHEVIHFDCTFLDQLYSLMWEAVWLSGGYQSVLRSNLPFVYRALAKSSASLAITISGLFADQILRGHANVPSLVPAALSDLFRFGPRVGAAMPFHDLFGSNFGEFADYIDGTVARMIDVEGNLTDSTVHLRHLVYHLTPKYFSGEISIADQYVLFRAPFLDHDIIRLAFDIEYSTLRFSQFSHGGKRHRLDSIVEATVIGRNRKIARLPIRGRSPAFYTTGSKALKSAIKWKDRIRFQKVLRQRRAASSTRLEDWRSWIAGLSAKRIEGHLGQNSRLSRYVEPAAAGILAGGHDIQLLGRLLTADMILSLIESRWRIPAAMRSIRQIALSPYAGFESGRPEARPKKYLSNITEATWPLDKPANQ